MRGFFTIVLLFAFCVLSAQEKKAVKDTLVYKYTPRYYNPAPCGCYSFPKKDSTRVERDTLKPALDITFARRKERWRF